MKPPIWADAKALRLLWPIFAIGILLFDLILLLTNAGWTISRAVVRGPWWWQIALCAAICTLIWHFWGT